MDFAAGVTGIGVLPGAAPTLNLIPEDPPVPREETTGGLLVCTGTWPGGRFQGGSVSPPEGVVTAAAAAAVGGAATRAPLGALATNGIVDGYIAGMAVAG